MGDACDRRQRPGSGRIVARSAALREALELVRRVAPIRSTVLVTGETGTGKELVADLLHRESPRRAATFVKVNCAALPETLLESELFGHERGAFTGADRRRVGRFEEASGGTLFLDEIGDLSPPTQAKLLRVLQDQEFHRLGGSRTLRTDARIVAATHRSLECEVRAGRFREDLYFRLDVIRVHLPPLRERPEDVAPLARHFLGGLAAGPAGTRCTGFTPGALARLRGHGWPGNVRELRNAVERTALLARGGQIRAEDLEWIGSGAERGATSASALEDAPQPWRTLAEMERAFVVETLRRCDFVQKDAALRLGISRRKLNYMIGRLGITHASWRRNRPPQVDARRRGEAP